MIVFGSGIPVARLMRTHPPTVPPTSLVSTLMHDYVLGTDDHAFPVLAEGQLVGLVTLQDIRSVSQAAWETTTVQQIMTPRSQLATISPETDAAAALTLLSQLDVRQLPVVQDGNLLGVLRRQDLIRWLQVHSEGWKG